MKERTNRWISIARQEHQKKTCFHVTSAWPRKKTVTKPQIPPMCPFSAEISSFASRIIILNFVVIISLVFLYHFNIYIYTCRTHSLVLLIFDIYFFVNWNILYLLSVSYFLILTLYFWHSSRLFDVTKVYSLLLLFNIPHLYTFELFTGLTFHKIFCIHFYG